MFALQMIPTLGMIHPSNQPKQKTKWTPEEDEKLLEAVKQCGMESWIRVALHVQGRNSKQCRERYMGQLSPKIIKAEWTLDEDQILAQQHKIHGNKWTTIASMLPGRSAINVKNRWSRLKRHPDIHNQTFTNDNKNDCILTVDQNQSDVIVQKPSSVSFEFPIINSPLFGEDFVQFQENMFTHI
ncbi:Myb-like DNA-binding domain containing protein [Tritrichomonas foetus]|uniref:Myb-like DNA-binding domain containing protein n=1 Tax=Tritrichomonas foetus TaxID=1144522 RepID=A0A1J4KB30_9EUKA|nr:Myb-like DNA-binding domain containing protein [Tritrichomonas foetus]|eukprot:OHT06900.1 Myb-like DNA-binding domain containing protein [Tritrichomonas foetus]